MNLPQSFGASMFKAWGDPIADTIDNAIDNLSDNPIVANLPIVKYFIAAGNTALAVRERAFVRKSLKFFNQLGKEQIAAAEIEKRKQALADEEKWVRDEMELLIQTLDRIDREEKAKIISKLYAAFLDGKLNKIHFDDFCSITERLFLVDIVELRARYDEMLDKEKLENLVLDDRECRVFSSMSLPEHQGRLLALGLLMITANTHERLTLNENLLEYKLSMRGKRYSEMLSELDFLGMTTRVLDS